MLWYSMAWQTNSLYPLQSPTLIGSILVSIIRHSDGIGLGCISFQHITLLWCNEFCLLNVVSTYFMSYILHQTWDLYSWQWCCAQKLWGEPNRTKGQFLYYVALKVASHNLNLTLLPFCRKCSRSVLHSARFMCDFALCVCVFLRDPD